MTVVRGSVRGEPVALCAYDGKLFRLVSARAFAPGQPLVVEAALGSPVTLELKSVGSVRLADGTFEVRARASTLSRQARSALTKAFALAFES